jgi:peptide/nickel transport system substrate-binding protein
MEWGVEVPVYQRQECFILSSERIDIETVTPDITTYWSWMNDIENLEMKPVAN